MAFAIRNLSVLAYANGFTLWHYKSGRDRLDTVVAEISRRRRRHADRGRPDDDDGRRRCADRMRDARRCRNRGHRAAVLTPCRAGPESAAGGSRLRWSWPCGPSPRATAGPGLARDSSQPRHRLKRSPRDHRGPEVRRAAVRTRRACSGAVICPRTWIQRDGSAPGVFSPRSQYFRRVALRPGRRDLEAAVLPIAA